MHDNSNNSQISDPLLIARVTHFTPLSKQRMDLLHECSLHISSHHLIVVPPPLASRYLCSQKQVELLLLTIVIQKSKMFTIAGIPMCTNLYPKHHIHRLFQLLQILPFHHPSLMGFEFSDTVNSICLMHIILFLRGSIIFENYSHPWFKNSSRCCISFETLHWTIGTVPSQYILHWYLATSARPIYPSNHTWFAHI